MTHTDGDLLKLAEETFEFIRLKLIDNLDEPQRSAFWKAVKMREKIRHSASASTAGRGEVEQYVAWIAFAENRNIRFWTSDYNRAIEERRRGMDLRAFTLAELVALISRASPPAAETAGVKKWRKLGLRILSYFDLNAKPENDLAQGHRKELAALLFDATPADTSVSVVGDVRAAVIEECARAVENYNPDRAWSADPDMQNQAYYTGGEVQSEIVDLIRALTSQGKADAGSAAQASRETYLGYRNDAGEEMHCANAFCPHQDKCIKGCISRKAMAVPSADGGDAA